jgi:hypothetical protein
MERGLRTEKMSPSINRQLANHADCTRMDLLATVRANSQCASFSAREQAPIESQSVRHLLKTVIDA